MESSHEITWNKHKRRKKNRNFGEGRAARERVHPSGKEGAIIAGIRIGQGGRKRGSGRRENADRWAKANKRAGGVTGKKNRKMVHQVLGGRGNRQEKKDQTNGGGEKERRHFFC